MCIAARPPLPHIRGRWPLQRLITAQPLRPPHLKSLASPGAAAKNSFTEHNKNGDLGPNSIRFILLETKNCRRQKMSATKTRYQLVCKNVCDMSVTCLRHAQNVSWTLSAAPAPAGRAGGMPPVGNSASPHHQYPWSYTAINGGSTVLLRWNYKKFTGYNLKVRMTRKTAFAVPMWGWCGCVVYIHFRCFGER